LAGLRGTGGQNGDHAGLCSPEGHRLAEQRLCMPWITGLAGIRGMAQQSRDCKCLLIASLEGPRGAAQTAEIMQACAGLRSTGPAGQRW
jgi:hypothetical protein